LRCFRHFSKIAQNAVPATVFESSFATSQNAAPATQNEIHKQKVLRLPRKNNTLILTRLQSIAPATRNAKMTSLFDSLKRQNEHFVRDFLEFAHV